MIKAHHLDPNTFLYPLWLIFLLLQLISLASNLLFLHLIFFLFLFLVLVFYRFMTFFSVLNFCMLLKVMPIFRFILVLILDYFQRRT